MGGIIKELTEAIKRRKEELERRRGSKDGHVMVRTDPITALMGNVGQLEREIENIEKTEGENAGKKARRLAQSVREYLKELSYHIPL